MTLINYYYYIEHLKQIFVIYFKVGWGGGSLLLRIRGEEGSRFQRPYPRIGARRRRGGGLDGLPHLSLLRKVGPSLGQKYFHVYC